MVKKKLKKRLNYNNSNFLKTLLTSFIIIFIFSVLPNTISFIKNSIKSNQVVLNSSKQNSYNSE